ncbi:hypothetical protein BLNAU_1631 [Blattamonas nauphoetae]|uniref:Uncharacterized protein n=1 Tax=Blattamonas nauphoetae TaxID=2049346 RepID=A0ABQ9YIJ6_9EUKA|nr:hypothetical protein BLNAU_1631 [Blattamonas nauphoetae]
MKSPISDSIIPSPPTEKVVDGLPSVPTLHPHHNFFLAPGFPTPSLDVPCTHLLPHGGLLCGLCRLLESLTIAAEEVGTHMHRKRSVGKASRKKEKG